MSRQVFPNDNAPITPSPSPFADWDPTSVPDAHDIATEWVSSTWNLKANAPAAADLATMITGVGTDFTMQGAPELEIDLLDQDWTLLDSGFFDPLAKGTLDKIDINYPVGSKYHWRIFQVSPNSDYTVQTYWIPRVVGDLMSLNAKHNPLSASRSSRTRAQFLKMMVGKVPYANFYSGQLTTVQQISQLNIPTSTTKTRKQITSTKSVGISASAMDDADLTVQGKAMGDRQRANVNTALRIADKYGAGVVATQALIYAGIWESNFEALTTPNQDNEVGVWQSSASVWQGTDVAGQATSFLLGGKGFQAGGAIALSATVTNFMEVAVKVEVPSNWPVNGYAEEAGYIGNAKATAEVNAIIAAGGGASGTGGVAGDPTEIVQQYNFAVGTTSDPNEDYWTAANRLAQEVNWEIVIDGDDVYYDSDVTLCRDQIAAVINRQDEGVASWSYDWNRTQLPTNFELILQCDPFEFKPADVFKLNSFGPASAGSAIKLPGRWLVGEIQRNPGDIVSTFTLIQPTQPLPEPAATLGLPTTSTQPNQVTLTGQAVNPFAEATNLVVERTDQGKDYSMSPGSPILAPFDSMYLGLSPGWFRGQPYIAFKIVGGTYNGWAYYLAEQINPVTFTNGQIIKAGTTIAHYAASGTGIEMGLANPKEWQQTLAQANGHWSSYMDANSIPSPEGERWTQILKALGAPVGNSGGGN